VIKTNPKEISLLTISAESTRGGESRKEFRSKKGMIDSDGGYNSMIRLVS